MSRKILKNLRSNISPFVKGENCHETCCYLQKHGYGEITCKLFFWSFPVQGVNSETKEYNMPRRLDLCLELKPIKE